MVIPVMDRRPWLVKHAKEGVPRPPAWRDSRELHLGHYRFAVHLQRVDEGLGLACRVGEHGAVLVGVDEGSAAARSGLRAGMRIVSIHGHSIHSDSDLVMARQFAARDASLCIVISATNIHLNDPNGHLTPASYKVADAVAIRTIPHTRYALSPPRVEYQEHFPRTSGALPVDAARLSPRSPRFVIYNTDFGGAVHTPHGAFGNEYQNVGSPGGREGGPLSQTGAALSPVYSPRYAGRVPAPPVGYTEYEYKAMVEDPFPPLQSGLPPPIRIP